MLIGTGAAVSQAAVVSGAIQNIGDYYSNAVEPDDDITINLRNLMTWAVVYSGKADAIAHYVLNNIDPQSYWIELKVADADGQPNPEFPAYTTGALLNVTEPEVTKDFALPTASNTFTLTVNLFGDYSDGENYSYSIKKASDFSEAASGDGSSDSFSVDLAGGTYRLSILAENYAPYEYSLADNYEISLIGDKEIDAELTAADFHPNAPVVTVSHESTGAVGFVLSVVTDNFSENGFGMAITGVGDVPSGQIEGSGTADDPYIYNWTPVVGPNYTDGPYAGDKTYNVEFTFSNDDAALTDYSYTVKFVIYADEANAEADKAEDQRELEDEYGDDPAYIILGEKEFIPLIGGTVYVTLKDHFGQQRDVAIRIPPIPSSLLFIDDYPDANNNLNYSRVRDRYNIPSPPLKNIAPTDILKLKIKYYTFGPRALGTAVSLSFEVSRGQYAGQTVRYNPIKSATVGRNPNAPEIMMPLLLNPQSRVFRNFARLSQAKARLCVLVSERGDGRFFHVEKLPFTVQDDGLMWVQVHHLTTVGVDEVVEASSSEGGSGGGCFIATAAYGSYFEQHVKILRQLRDDILLQSPIGRAFVKAYYRTSPPIADFIAGHDALRAMVRWSLAPVVGLSWVALHYGMLAALVIMFMLLALVSGSGFMLYRERKQ
jgi:hypothetical protein